MPAAGGKAVSPVLTGWQATQRCEGTGGQDHCSPTASGTHLCYLGFRVAPKANTDPEQGSFGECRNTRDHHATWAGGTLAPDSPKQFAQAPCHLYHFYSYASVENEQHYALPISTGQLRCGEINCHSKTAQASSSSLCETSRGKGPVEQRRGL